MPEAETILIPSPARPAMRRAGLPFRDLMRWYRQMRASERRRRREATADPRYFGARKEAA